MGKYHSNKEISSVIEFALEQGWRFRKSKGHVFGRLFCPANRRGACIVSVYSTPRVPHNHAEYIRKEVNNCEH